ncbi:MAG TPA: IclR family transcriptional regulator [Burkholderiaceae bacterium]|nr:IclR family transcriptional regulator [Burkholderiaceae bacterium]
MYSTLLTGLTVLDHLAESEHPCGVTEVAASLHISKSSAHRILQTLMRAGYVKQSEGSNYQCTLKMWHSASRIMQRVDVFAEARIQMKALSEATGETILLAILENGYVTYVDRIESRLPLHVHGEPGERYPAHCVATGKLLLSFASDKALAAATRRMRKFTSRTIVDATTLCRELVRIKADRFVINRGEHREGISGLAVPIFDASGTVIAAIGLAGPSERLTDKVIRNHATLALKGAQRVSESLGYNAIKRVIRGR